MRLIDADALKQADFQDFSNTDVFNAIDEAPTISAAPVVRGEWLVTDAYPHRVYCSVCYKTNVPNEEWLFEKNEYPHFCMWCGAKMLRFGHSNGTT